MLEPTSPFKRHSERRRAAVVALVAALTFSALASFPSGASAATKPKNVVRIAAGELTVHRVAGDHPQTIPDEVRDKVMATVTAYLNAATVKALKTGTVDEGALAATLAPAAIPRAAGPDRAALVDEGLPIATKRIVVTSEPVALTGLADADGRVVVVTAGLAATTKTKTAKGGVLITRRGDLVLTPDGDTWKIDGYDLIVGRTGKALGIAGATTTTLGSATPAGGTATR